MEISRGSMSTIAFGNANDLDPNERYCNENETSSLPAVRQAMIFKYKKLEDRIRRLFNIDEHLMSSNKQRAVEARRSKLQGNPKAVHVAHTLALAGSWPPDASR